MSAPVLRATFGACPECEREVLADGWNRSERVGCYWCGFAGAIPCAPMSAPSFRPDPETLRWAAGQVLASGPATPDTTPLYCAEHYIRAAAKRLRGHADYLESDQS